MKFKKKCFVLMPFEEKYREVFTEIYKVVCRNNGIECTRVDEVNKPGSITRAIINGIIESDIIIADLTARNPNVFYELGIAHCVGNKTIMTCQRGETLPFDISAYRVIFYDQTIQGSKELIENIDKSIQELLGSSFEANNPVQEIISIRTTNPQKIILTSAIDFNSMTIAVQKYLFAKKILYTTDVHKIDFYDMKNSKGIAKEGMTRLINELLKNELHDSPEFLKSFL